MAKINGEKHLFLDPEIIYTSVYLPKHQVMFICERCGAATLEEMVSVHGAFHTRIGDR